MSDSMDESKRLESKIIELGNSFEAIISENYYAEYDT